MPVTDVRTPPKMHPAYLEGMASFPVFTRSPLSPCLRLLELHDVGLLTAVLARGAVFARMTPDNKRDLVELLGAGTTRLPTCPNLVRVP
jgi:hypothetical protein